MQPPTAKLFGALYLEKSFVEPGTFLRVHETVLIPMQIKGIFRFVRLLQFVTLAGLTPLALSTMAISAGSGNHGPNGPSTEPSLR